MPLTVPGVKLDSPKLPELTFQGFLAFSDPVRPSAAAAIRGLRQAGVDVVIVALTCGAKCL